MAVRIRWFGNQVIRAVNAIGSRNVARAAELLRQDIRRSLFTVGPSRPGKPPRMRTGNLANSIFARPAEILTWRVGTNVAHGVFLELGTRTRTITVKRARVLARPVDQYTPKALMRAARSRGAGLPVLWTSPSGKQFIIFGRRVTNKIEPHPFIIPAVIRNKRNLARLIARGRL